MIKAFVDPKIKYKYLLDKGEELTTKQVIYLHMKGVDKTTIKKATKLNDYELNDILRGMDSAVQNHKKAVDNMGKITKFNMTKEKAEQLAAEGKNKSEIAKIAGVSLPTYLHHEKKWNGTATIKEHEIVVPLKSKELAPVLKESEEYKKAINDLKFKLSYSEQVNEQKDKLNQELVEQNKQLQARIEQLEQEKMDLHAAASDTEKEAIDYLERESELLIDADVWKQQAQMYQGENKRLNDNLSEVRQELAKYKGENVLAKAFIKAVL